MPARGGCPCVISERLISIILDNEVVASAADKMSRTKPSPKHNLTLKKSLSNLLALYKASHMSLVEKDYRLELESKAESIAEVEGFVDQIREDVELPDELYGNILIALTEAVNNCIIHGNKFSPVKRVVLTCAKKDNVIEFAASDEGDGFDFEHLPDPTAPENIEKATGRGVYLMRQLSDYLKYSNGGATVTMRFNIQLQ